MKKRIEELMEETGVYLPYENKEVTHAELEFFAETIIRECAKLANTDSSYPYKDFGDKIKAHFGINP